MTVMYLYTRLRFNWDEVDYSVFSTYMMITNLLGMHHVFKSKLVMSQYFRFSWSWLFSGTMFSICVFSHLLQIDDTLIGIIACMSKILAGFVYAFATSVFVFYLGMFKIQNSICISSPQKIWPSLNYYGYNFIHYTSRLSMYPKIWTLAA